jgi:hypothetical protein
LKAPVPIEDAKVAFTVKCNAPRFSPSRWTAFLRLSSRGLE